MTTEIHLTKKDIQKILAERFDVRPDAVDVCCYMDIEGYGLGEREVPSVRAVIEIKEE